eukprot:8396210-Pyramimonas_sp.AAC.1
MVAVVYTFDVVYTWRCGARKRTVVYTGAALHAAVAVYDGGVVYTRAVVHASIVMYTRAVGQIATCMLLASSSSLVARRSSS